MSIRPRKFAAWRCDPSDSERVQPFCRPTKDRTLWAPRAAGHYLQIARRVSAELDVQSREPPGCGLIFVLSQWRDYAGKKHCCFWAIPIDHQRRDWRR